MKGRMDSKGRKGEKMKRMRERKKERKEEMKRTGRRDIRRDKGNGRRKRRGRRKERSQEGRKKKVEKEDSRNLGLRVQEGVKCIFCMFAVSMLTQGAHLCQGSRHAIMP